MLLANPATHPAVGPFRRAVAQGTALNTKAPICDAIGRELAKLP